MRLNKRELSEKLGTSETTLTQWQKDGMPVLEHGSRGKPGVYDLAAVVSWIRQNGREIHPRTGIPTVDILSLERECGLAPAPAAAQVQFPDRLTIHELKLAIQASFGRTGAQLVTILGLSPVKAVTAIEMVLMGIDSAFEDRHADVWLGWLPDELCFLDDGPIAATATVTALLQEKGAKEFEDNYGVYTYLETDGISEP